MQLSNLRTIEKELLTKHNIRKTPFRLKLIALFLKTKTSLSPEEIIHYLHASHNKVTVYRALDSFEKKGLIHKVPDINNMFRYALCKSDCSESGHIHNHIHFICDNCKDTFCISQVEIPQVSLPNGFVIQKTHLTTTGYCPNCNSKTKNKILSVCGK